MYFLCVGLLVLYVKMSLNVVLLGLMVDGLFALFSALGGNVNMVGCALLYWSVCGETGMMMLL